MKHIKEMNDARFIMTQDEIGYQEVLEDFTNANYILIVTFNISEKKFTLINYLHNVTPNTVIDIFTNIPQRYSNYFSDGARYNAKKKIRVYINRLDPEKFGSIVNSHFCFNNHSKIIMTENIAYIGSANFSDESMNNFESGILTRDKSTIMFIKEEIVPFLEEDSVSYYSNHFSQYKVMLSLLYSKLINMQEKFHEATHNFADFAGKEFEYFSINEYSFGLGLLEELDNCLNDFKLFYKDLQSELETDEEWPDDIKNIVSEMDLTYIINLYGYDTNIYQLADFDEEEYQQNFFNDYLAEAYDEYLGVYQERAAQAANDKKSELQDSAKDDILELAREINTLREKSEEILNLIPNIVNTEINNT